MGWLERARREISKCAGQGTAISAERSLTAVTAVPNAGETEITGLPVPHPSQMKAETLT